MEAQEAFDAVWNWFIVDKNPPSIKMTDYKTECMYRSPEGRRCAAGVLISDEEYQKWWEGKPIGWVLKNYPSIKNKLGSIVLLVAEMQYAHDVHAIDEEIDFHYYFEYRLRQIASDYGLKVKE